MVAVDDFDRRIVAAVVIVVVVVGGIDAVVAVDVADVVVVLVPDDDDDDDIPGDIPVVGWCCGGNCDWDFDEDCKRMVVVAVVVFVDGVSLHMVKIVVVANFAPVHLDFVDPSDGRRDELAVGMVPFRHR